MNVAGIVSVSLLASVSLGGAALVAHYEDRLEAAWTRLVNRVTGLHPTREEDDDRYDYY